MVPTAQPISRGANERLGLLTLLAVTFVWGTTFVVMADVLRHMTACWLMVGRFGLALACLVPLALRRLGQMRLALLPGIRLGALTFLGFVLQTQSLHYTTEAHCAFGCSLVTVFVPVLSAAMYKVRPAPSTALALGFAIAGVLLLVGAQVGGLATGHPALAPGSMLLGDLLAGGSAAAFAGQVLFIGRLGAGVPLLPVVFIEVACVLVLSLVAALGGGDPWPQVDLSTLGGVTYLGVAATAGCLLGQMFGQARTDATRAAFVYATEPAFAAGLAWLCRGQAMTPTEMGGGLLMTAAAAVAERPMPRLRWRPKRRARAALPSPHLPGEHDGHPPRGPRAGP